MPNNSWPSPIANIGTLVWTVRIISRTDLRTLLGFPGPLESTTPSGSNRNISSAVAVYGKTVILHFRRLNSRNIPFFNPKSITTTLSPIPGLGYGLGVETCATCWFVKTVAWSWSKAWSSGTGTMLPFNGFSAFLNLWTTARVSILAIPGIFICWRYLSRVNWRPLSLVPASARERTIIPLIVGTMDS